MKKVIENMSEFVKILQKMIMALNKVKNADEIYKTSMSIINI
jgi:hypothetical protein